MPAVLVAGFADAALLLLYLIGWGVTLGLLYTWNATFHHLFQGIAKALTFRIGVGFGPSKTIHLGGWADSIDHTAQELLSDWALGCEILVGKFWHALTWIFAELAGQIRANAEATLALGKWIVHEAVPAAIDAAEQPWRNKSNKAAAAAGAAGLGLALLRKITRAEHRAETAANEAAQSAAHAAQHTATHAHAVATTVEHTVTHDTKVITQVIDVGAIPAQFGRTVTSIRRRLGRVEALLGATAMAAAMANVLGLPNPRCLTRGPLGRFSRFFCGLDSWLVNLLLLGTVEAFIVSDLCDFSDLVLKTTEGIRPGLMELVDVESALVGCHDFTAPPILTLTPLELPALYGVSALAA
jgi:hypothetical protein